MKVGLLSIGATLLLSLGLAACGGGEDKPSALPEKGADVCADLKKAERMRYTIEWTLNSPKQTNPADDSAAGQWALRPSQPDFNFQTSYTGAFVQPDKLDFQLSTTPDQPSVRGIRIGENQWFQLSGTWVPSTERTAFPFTPAIFCDAIVSPLDLTGKIGTSEKVGDTDAQHVRIDAAPISPAAQLFGEQSDHGRLLKAWDVDLWLSNKDFRLVKVEAVAKASYPYGRELSQRLSLEVGSFDDDNIDIKQPI